jgi:hypothetical protein
VDQGACTRARRARGSASDARRARATTARTATAADIVGSLVDAVPKGMGFRRESAGASFLIRLVTADVEQSREDLKIEKMD